MTDIKWIKVTSYQQLLQLLDERGQIDGVVMLGYGGRSSKTFIRNEYNFEDAGEVSYEMYNHIDNSQEPLTEERTAEYIKAGALFLESYL